MTTQNIGIVLREELNRREKLIEQLNKECDGLRTALGILERPSPESLNRVTRVVGRGRRKKNTEPAPPQTRRRTDGEKACKLCGKSKVDGAEFTVNRVNKDGLDTRCKECRRKEYRNRNSKSNGHDTTKTTLSPGGAGRLADTHSRIAKAGADSPKIPCDRCGEKFPDAKAMGIHKTRVHFGAEA